MKKIAIIPARSGSKGLPDKNILNLAGKPLIAWTIESAIKSECFDRIIVSTDSEEYGDISKKYGAEVFYRKGDTSTDEASMYVVIKELLNSINKEEFDYFTLLQPTSPLRNYKHIKEAIKLFENNYDKKNTLVSMQKTRKSSILVKPIEDDLSLKYFDLDYSNYSRQQYNEYETNGAIFISKVKHYLETKHFFGETGIAYIMDKESSIDIDDKMDFEIAIMQIMKNDKKKLLDKRIKGRIDEKKELFNKKIDDSNSIALIGHSQIDKWNVKKILSHNVINYGISGISSFEYNDLILSKKIIKTNSRMFIIMHGTNDIIYDKTNDEIFKSIEQSVKYIKENNKDASIYFVQCLNTNGRMDRTNEKINELNKFLELKLDKDVNWINTNKLNNKYGKLDLSYTYDGLHLNEKGYDVFKEIIEKALENNNV